MMIVIYVAGAYRAKDGKTVAENIEAARRASVEVWRSGHIALCPHLNSAHFEDYLGENYTDQMFLDGTMELLRRCDAILMLPGWEDSEDAIAEYRYAREHELHTFFWDSEKKTNSDKRRNCGGDKCLVYLKYQKKFAS